MLKYILISFLLITNAYAYTCEEMGYTMSITDCPDGGLKCPAQPEKMFCCDPCGDGRGYRYNKSNCSPDDGLQLAGIECGGKWTECRECSSEYKYNKNNCRKPRVLAGLQCANAYTKCINTTNVTCEPTVGYIYYSDGSCGEAYDDSKEAIGIIVDAARKTIIALDENPMAYWHDASSKYLDVTDLPNLLTVADVLLDMDGEGNTDIIVAFALSSGQEQRAAQYCANKEYGNKKWYLPAIGELNILYNNLENIQNILTSVPQATKLSLKKYWSSNEYDTIREWAIDFSDGSIFTNYEFTTISVRCFAHF